MKRGTHMKEDILVVIKNGYHNITSTSLSEELKTLTKEELSLLWTLTKEIENKIKEQLLNKI